MLPMIKKDDYGHHLRILLTNYNFSGTLTIRDLNTYLIGKFANTHVMMKNHICRPTSIMSYIFILMSLKSTIDFINSARTDRN